jgi:sugar lactone lactonase YvrE
VLAGKPGPRLTFSDGPAAKAGFIEPQGIAVAPDGSVYVSDYQTIRKITTAGTTTTFAGLPAADGFKNGDGRWALFHDPVGLAADTQGNLYLADRGNNSIRRITKSGMVSTFNEWGADWGLSCDLGGYKQLRNPTWVAVDDNHNLYVSGFDSQILQIMPGGRTLTLNDPAGKGVRFSNPKGVTVDRNGKVYVLEADHITVGSPVVCPCASTSRATDILATSATLQGTIQASGATTFARFEYGLTEDYDHSIDVIPPPAKRNAVGNVSVVISGLERGKTYHYRLICGNRQGTGVGADASFTTTWGVITFAGSPAPGARNGFGTNAQFDGPSGVAIGHDGTMYVADTDTGVAVDRTGNIHIADSGNARICTLDPAGQVRTRASRRGDLSRLIEPSGITLDDTGTIYVTDDDCVRMLTPTNRVVTVAGHSKPNRPKFPPTRMMINDYLLKYQDGPCKLARFSMPQAIAVGSDGSLYVADTGNNTIRRIFPDDSGPKQR